jgi:hypothetical protein
VLQKIKVYEKNEERLKKEKKARRYGRLTSKL